MEEHGKLERKLKNVVWFFVENVPSILTVAFTAWVLIQSQRSTLQVMEVLLWLLGIVGLLATSELIERFRHLKRIEEASFKILDAIQAKERSELERLGLLVKIDEKLEKWPEQELLRDRSELIRMEELAVGATEVWAAGISLASIIHPYDAFYIQKLKEGCNLRFLVLEPNSNATKVWDKAQLNPTSTKDIETSLEVLENLMKLEKLKGKCQVRLASIYLPYSLVIVDGPKDSGRMIVEMLAYKKSLHDRRHLQLTKRNHEKDFRFFCEQFELLWADSRQPALIQISISL